MYRPMFICGMDRSNIKHMLALSGIKFFNQLSTNIAINTGSQRVKAAWPTYWKHLKAGRKPWMKDMELMLFT